jgi:hypothetical protein
LKISRNIFKQSLSSQFIYIYVCVCVCVCCAMCLCIETSVFVVLIPYVLEFREIKLRCLLHKRTHSKIEQRRPMRCLPSRDTVWEKSDDICQIKQWPSITYLEKHLNRIAGRSEKGWIRYVCEFHIRSYCYIFFSFCACFRFFNSSINKRS